MFVQHTCSISRMLAYRGAGNTPSSSTVPGKLPCKTSDTPQPSKPAATATPRTPGSDHVEADRGPWPLPATARRNDEVVKRCRPAAQGLFEAARDRPRGLAALAKRLADMQEKSRRMCSVQVWLANSNNTAFCYKYCIGSPLPYPGYLQMELWVNSWVVSNFQTFRVLDPDQL